MSREQKLGEDVVVAVDTKERPMADDLTNRGPQDRSRISMSEDYEVRYWTKALGVSKEELQKLVDEHGNSAANIKEVLGK
jgi:hypothetical protein